VEIQRRKSSGLFQPIDTSRLSNWPDIIPELWQIPGNETVEGKPYFVPLQSATALVTDLSSFSAPQDVVLTYPLTYNTASAIFRPTQSNFLSLAIFDVQKIDACHPVDRGHAQRSHFPATRSGSKFHAAFPNTPQAIGLSQHIARQTKLSHHPVVTAAPGIWHITCTMQRSMNFLW